MELIKKELATDLALRWERMQRYMREKGADGCLLGVGVNLFYATGRVYNGYCYIPAESEPWFFVKRPNGLAGKHVEYIRKPEQIAEIFAAKGMAMPQALLMEADELTYGEYVRLESVFNPGKRMNATAMMRELRMVKTPWEIGQLRSSARKHAETYSEIPSLFRPGMTDVQLQAEIERVMRLNGSLGAFRVFGANMDIFMGSILAGDNAEAPSPFDYALGGAGMDDSLPIGADGRTVLKEGMAVMIDMAGNYTPYTTDMTRVYSVGKLPDEAYRAHRTSIDIQDAVMDMSAPGTVCADIYNRAAEMAAEAGFAGCFMGTRQQAKFVGHGIGLQINELPVLTPRSKEILEPGMVFALEPKFVIPRVGAVGIENSFLVTDTGLEKLTVFEESIIHLD